MDQMKVNLVVVDLERTDKTICFAVSPAMKELGVPGKCCVIESQTESNISWRSRECSFTLIISLLFMGFI